MNYIVKEISNNSGGYDLAKIKVFPYRLHTNGGHVVQVYSSYSSPRDLLQFLDGKTVVDIFWTPSTQGNVFVPMIIKASSVEIISPVFGRSGIVVEEDGLGNLVYGQTKDVEEKKQPVVGQTAKKRA
jgi:hypothetical protein